MPIRSNTWNRILSFRRAPTTIRALVRREFGLRVRTMKYYEEALTHSSMLDGDSTGLKSNERLEFLGDTALDLIVASYLFQDFPNEQEGGLTQRKSKIVNRKTLNLVGEKMDLALHIRAKMRRKDIHSTVVGNALEALIGAIYLDHGFHKTDLAVMRMLRRHGADHKVHETVDFKSKLHHWAQRKHKTLDFEVVREYHEKGATRYDVHVHISGELMGSGKGSSKKSAEQRAARMAWRVVFQSNQSSNADSEIPDENSKVDPSDTSPK
jgi:ribonuclease-3